MQMVQRNQPGKGRKNRIGISIETEYENKLNKLAIACGNMAPTTMAWLLVKQCLDNAEMIFKLQEEFATTADYRVVVVTDPANGKKRLEVLR